MKKWVGLLITTILLPGILPANETEMNNNKVIANSLVDKGFENVVARLVGQHLTIAYENRIYRSELTAMGVVLQTVLKSDVRVEQVKIIPLNRGIPLSTIELNLSDFNSLITGNSDNSTFSSQISTDMGVNEDFLKNVTYSNPSFKKVELTFKPGVKSRFHTREGLAIWKIDLVSEIAVTLSKGFQVTAEGIFPLAYQYDQDSKEIKLGRVILNNTIRHTKHIWSSTSIGIFDRDRYGISFENTSFWKNGQVSLSVRMDYTGYLHYTKGTWEYSSPDQLTYWGSVGYRLIYPDVYFQVGWGKFLYSDKGWKIALIRSFGELDLGFYGLWPDLTDLKKFNGGVTISIPLPFLQWEHNNGFIRSVKQFSWGIQYHTESDSRLPDSGTSVDAYYKRIFPTYVKNNPELIIGGN